jgi:hypothetical protein
MDEEESKLPGIEKLPMPRYIKFARDIAILGIVVLATHFLKLNDFFSDLPKYTHEFLILLEFVIAFCYYFYLGYKEGGKK